LKLGTDGLPPNSTREELAEIGARISAAERRAMAAERETVDRLIAHHLADRIGAEFEGRISGVTKSGLFVKLAETGADGFVPIGTVGNDYYRYEEATHSLRGERTGETYRLGDPVSVRLVEAAPVAGALRFEILSEGRITGGSGRKRSGRPEKDRKPRGRTKPRVKDKPRRAGA
jgi:ribonuclease R